MLAVVLVSVVAVARRRLLGWWVDPHVELRRDMRGRTVVVTGGTCDSLGAHVAALLAGLGARVIVTTRTKAKGLDACERVADAAASGGSCEFVLMDLLSDASVRRAAAEIAARLRGAPLDVLVLNAGTLFGTPADIFQANYLGHFRLVELLRPHLLGAARTHGDVRVIALSSDTHVHAAIDHDSPFEPRTGGPYMQSKLAAIMHMRELQRRMCIEAGGHVEPHAIKCVSVHPGFTATGILQLTWWMRPLRPLLFCLSRSVRSGARGVALLACASDITGGSFYANFARCASRGLGGCSNDPRECSRLWLLSERCLEESRHP